MGQKYNIFVGRQREDNAESGFLDRNNSHIIRGESKPVSIQVGAFGIPNGTEAYGIRLINGKKPENNQMVTVENPEYTGQIEFVKWGTHEKLACPIRCRYVPGYPTLDKDYQDLRLKVSIPENSAYAALIVLKHGDNEFDEIADAAMVQMLKIHHHNSKSIYANPEAEGWMYTEVLSEEIDRAKTKAIDNKFECILLVNKASNKPDSIKALFDIVKGIETKEVNKDDVQDIFNNLKWFADQQPDVFSNRVHEYKRKVSDVFSKLESFNAIDVTKDGFIAAGVNKKDLIFDNIPAKGKDMISYCYENFLEPGIYAGIEKLEKIAEKIK